jgi:hypothetical protein
VETGNGGNDAQAEPISGIASTPLQSIEAPEDVLMLANGNSWAIVGDRDHGAGIIPSDVDGRLTGLTAMFNRIVDEIGDGIEQQVLPITGDEHRSISDNIDMHIFAFRCGVE